MRGTLSPKLTEFLTQVNAAAAEAKAQGVTYTPEIVRGNLDKLAAFIPNGPDITFVQDRSLTLNGRVINTRVYSPDPAAALPVLIHYHGGGHMCGSIDLYDSASRMMAKMANCVVICPDYRLAPEHPYPAGIDDCEAVLLNHRKLLDGVNHNYQLNIMGDSAGGAICTTLSKRFTQNSDIEINKQLLIYPSVDYTMQSASIEENGQGFLLEQARVKWYFEQYFQEKYSDGHTLSEASPLLGSFDRSMPETIVFTAGCDPLRDEGNAYVEKLNAAGVNVEHHQFDGMIHAYMLLHDLVKEECMETYQRLAAFLNK
ncbi:alpha/beta hydrolase [Thalassotalea sp. M1531]|uniref:Alpha/beta hydrolase n=1 Tax=Thalassotalea algicola TaxID=2716224 RepID=A0A7Y0LCJ4_9GAMM|nr:alpha/beta hydrolase [Thalassotalea algicola]NMP31807.1 alpha/beta hydrolase [Thalassotalea algicola]